MLDPDGGATGPASASEEVATSPSAPPPLWMKTYEPPTARGVVGAGMHLAASSSAAIRRASLYIGLLALGAFGPTVLLALLWIGRLVGDETTASTMATDPFLILLDQPGLAGSMDHISFLVLVGAILLVAISIDAQAIAIALLGGIAAERPLRLWEAVDRARQTFWRLAGAGLIVGITSAVISLLIALPFLRPFDSNTGVSFIASMIGALIVTPFAFASTGIVLGDVRAIESLQRSIWLFRARPRIAVVVVLFTLVTAALQAFALSAGLEVAVRVAEVMDLDLALGGVGLLVQAVIVLAFVMAFGSLTFTIAAIVAAPQVAAFLGLTFYSAGLEEARTPDSEPHESFHWVTRPMLVTIVGIALVAALGLPAVSAFEPQRTSPLLGYLRMAAQNQPTLVTRAGADVLIEDELADTIGASLPWIDIEAAGYAYLPDVPPWVLTTMFACDSDSVTCADPDPAPSAWSAGAFLFIQHMAGPPDAIPRDERREWGPILAIEGYERADLHANEPLGGGSHAYVTRFDLEKRSLHHLVHRRGLWTDVHSFARSAWIGSDLVTIIPASEELRTDPIAWDVYAALVYPSTRGGRDSLRSSTLVPMRAFNPPAPFYLLLPLE